MYSNLDKQVEKRTDPEPKETGVMAPDELSIDGLATEVTDRQLLIARVREARLRRNGW